VYTVKLNVHPDDCSCDRSPGCRGQFVVNLPDTGLTPRKTRDWDTAEAWIRDYARNGVPVGAPGVHGAVREPAQERLRHRAPVAPAAGSTAGEAQLDRSPGDDGDAW
jgi:hypothetical protein